MANLRWVGVDFHTGEVFDDLPNLILSKDGLKQVISTYSTATVTMPIVTDPPPRDGWFHYTTPYKAALVALDGSDPSPLQRPLWGGIITARNRTASALGAVLNLITHEAYLTRRFIRDTLQYPGANFGVCQVGVDLVNRYVVDGANLLNGPQLRIVMVDNGVPAANITWKDQDDKAIASAFSDQPFEYTGSWEWRTNANGVPILAPVMTLGTRIGTPAPAGMGPAATFDYPGGSLLDVTITDDWTDGKGANDVMSTSTGIGEVRPQSDHQLAADFEGRVTVEHRESAGTSIDSLSALNNDALANLAVLQDGATAISLQLAYGVGPVFGRDWNIGDDIGYSVSGPMYPENPNGVARAMGVAFAKSTYTPILAGDSS